MKQMWCRFKSFFLFDISDFFRQIIELQEPKVLILFLVQNIIISMWGQASSLVIVIYL